MTEEMDHSTEDEADDSRPTSELDNEILFRRLKKWFRASRQHFENWRTEAREDYGFVSGDQWTAEEISILKEQMRPVITFNRIDPVIAAVSGTEVTNRQEVRYLPRTDGDAAVDEIATSAAKWFRDMCDAEDEESDAFQDTLICGMGCTETRLDFEVDQEGAPLIERIDPFEMYPDPVASKRNFEDGRRVFRARKIPRDEARALVGKDVDDDELDASWASIDEGKNDKETQQEARFYRGGMASDDSKLNEEVTFVECQWWERENVHMVAGHDGKMQTLEDKDFKVFKKRATKLGMPVQAVTMTKRVYKRAYLGKDTVLLVEDSPFKDHFSYKFITGKRDRNKGTFYGLVKSMKDPQRWANKWLSQTLHIMNTNAKGGVMAEKGQADDDREFEQTYARPDAVTWVNQGALSGPNGPKIVPKPQSVLPQGYYNLLEFAIQSVRDASGVNLELLGMKDNEQAGVLEAQRKRQAMAILATMFDSLRRYRKSQGRLLLFIIQNYLNDSRLIRIVGEEGQKYVPLLLNPELGTYDIIIDDAPSSPQQKEVTWAVLTQMLPMIKEEMTPELWGTILPYSPLPASAVEKLKGMISSGAQQRQQAGEAHQQLTQADAQAKIRETNSKAMLNESKAQSEGQPDPSEMQGQQPDMGSIQKLHDMSLKHDDATIQRQRDDEKHRREMEMMDARLRGEVTKQRASARIAAGKLGETVDEEPNGESVADVVTRNSTEMMAQISQLFAQIKQEIDAPKQIVRDANGNVIGIKSGGSIKQVTRDESGRVVGLN